MSIQTQKTLELLRKKNMSCQIVERFIKSGKFGHRLDFLGIIDIIAIDTSVIPHKLVGAQSTSLSQRKEHLKTILEDQIENTKLWLLTGNDFLLICWRKLKKRKKDGGYSKVYMWEPKIDIIVLDDQGKPIIKDTEDVQQSV